MVCGPLLAGNKSKRGSGPHPLEEALSTQTKKKKRPKSPTEQAAYCLGHRIRVEALAILIERVASPRQIAAEIAEDLQLVCYHIDILRDANAIELIREEKRGAANEHFYRATMRPELSHEEWQELTLRHKQELAIISVRNLFSENLLSVESGRLVDDDEMFYWWKAVWLDPEGREEVRLEQEGHIARLLEIEAKANARTVGAKELLRQVPTVIAALGFDRGRAKPAHDIIP
jgi:DNA-binding transcriptional ArsR family regulator